MKILIAACIVLLQAESAVAQQCPKGEGWKLVSGRCLMCAAADLNLIKAKTDCALRGATVGPILDKPQHDFAEGCNTNNLAQMAADGAYTGLRARRTSTGVIERYWDDGTPYEGPPPGVTIDDNGETIGCYAIMEPNSWVLETDDFECNSYRINVCVRDSVSCQVLQAPTPSVVTYSLDSTPIQPDTVATYSCAEGYVLDRTNSNRMCLSNGSWDGEEPACILVDCGPLMAPSHGMVNYATSTFNSMASYSCNSGYSLGDVSPSRICQASGTWSGLDLTCSSDSNVLAIALGTTVGALALIGIAGCLLCQKTRVPQARLPTPGPAFPPSRPNPRPSFNLRRFAGPGRPPALAQRIPLN